MSTRLTNRGIPMVESLALQIAQSAGALREAYADYVAAELAALGYAGTTAAVLQFLSILECGINYGSDIARSLGVSRQMVAKTVRGLCDAGYLEQVDGPGRQKQILFTERGERMMSDARRILAEFDERMRAQLDVDDIKQAVEQINQIRELLRSRDTGRRT